MALGLINLYRLPVPEVWSPEGPVLDDGVLPLFRVHWKSPVGSATHSEVVSKSLSYGPKHRMGMVICLKKCLFGLMFQVSDENMNLKNIY